ncbi:DNA-binding transcriptional LysR family regulator [Kribbella orskensis]|uniref:DNA-binding transcriptional LysR family regulator n=1 Tax=Kribbella orskensis TaxID=2512216 RepID=A0ABY2BA98_9ACTN|nr:MULTISPECIES: LysR family transcriptional regulator [Kribbella]TCN30691.1 DNA-binding transcriptional LysR family regulator [Kribbella sp. VKM Ac-2500]TCO11410.1 DNA-binding transcriptional LysR family regulator [Kribbella orskensis]
MNVEYLRYAQAVAQAGSFSAAARELRVSQPSLSKGIAQLEAALGGKLYARSTQGVSPTPFGKQMLPLISAAISSIDALADSAREASTRARQAIRLGVSPLIDSGLVARAFAASRELLPERTLLLREANMMTLREALLSGALDLALMPAVSTIPGCVQQVVYTEPVVILEPPARHSSGPPSGPITLDSLGNDPLILVPDQCGLTAFTVDLFADRGIPLHRYPGEAANYQVLEEWSQLGLGAALLPVSKLSDPGHSARELQHNDQPVLIGYEAAWRKDSRAHAELAALVNAIAAKGANHPDRPLRTSSGATT